MAAEVTRCETPGEETARRSAKQCNWFSLFCDLCTWLYYVVVSLNSRRFYRFFFAILPSGPPSRSGDTRISSRDRLVSPACDNDPYSRNVTSKCVNTFHDGQHSPFRISLSFFFPLYLIPLFEPTFVPICVSHVLVALRFEFSIREALSVTSRTLLRSFLRRRGDLFGRSLTYLMDKESSMIVRTAWTAVFDKRSLEIYSSKFHIYI